MKTVQIKNYQKCQEWGKEVDEMTSITLKQPIRLKLQHHMNSLHVYSYICRLRVSKEKARKAVRVYELIVHPLLYA